MEWKQKEYHNAILKTKRELTDEEVFLSERYHRLLQRIAGEITVTHFQNIHIINDPLMPVGTFDGERILINLANHITQSFPNKDLKNKSMVGILGHECGHENFSNVHLRETYLRGILEDHKLYPHAPNPETEEEKEKLLSMQELFERGDSAALLLFLEHARYLNNVLEDAYIEQRMCSKYPGNIREGILLNNMRFADAVESVKAELEEGKSKSVVMMSMIMQYAGHVNYWNGCEREFLDCLDECIPIMNWAKYAEEESARFIATNQILLKMWDFIKEDADELEEEGRKQEQEEQEQNEPEQDGSEQNESEKNESEQNKTEALQDDASAGDSETEQKQTAGLEEKNAGESEKTQNPDKGQLQQFVKKIIAVLPELSPDYAGGKTDEASDVSWDGKWEIQPTERTELKAGVNTDALAESKEVSEENQKEEVFPKSSFPVPPCNDTAEEKPQFDQEISSFVFNLAREITDQKQEEELRLSLRGLLHDIDYGDQHANVRKQVYRESYFSEETVKRYYELSRQLQKTRMEKGMVIGRKMDNRTLYRPDHRIFARRQLEDNECNAAIAVLVDLSGSMAEDERIAYARLAALTLYQFSIEAGIPVTVYGHNVRRLGRSTEQVCLYSLAEFGSVDRKDGLRIVDMKPRGCNRDGVAIRFVGEHLKRRCEKQKLFVLISDGLPNASGYGGASAREDLKSAKAELEKAGITFIAAAIGDDRNNIQEIYEEAFLDISNLQKLPEKLAKQVIRTIS